MNSISRNLHFSFSTVALAILIGLVGPVLFREGMFLDGIIYATVAKKLAAGIGTFWNLEWYSPLLDSYRDQPPLGIWIQSLFFYLLGNGFYTERIYSLLTALITALSIHKLWKEIHRQNISIQAFSWVPVVLWIIVPISFWSYSNNMLENTMAVFVLWSVIFIFKNKNQFNAWNVVASGLFIFLAAMIKGIQGVFSVSLPFLLFIAGINRNFTDAAKSTFVLVFIPAVLFGIIWLIPDARSYFLDYFERRLVHTFVSPEFVNENRLHLLKKLAEGLVVPAILCLVVFFFFRDGYKRYPFNSRLAVAFLLLALAGSLPLMITLEQRRFYLVTTLPYYALVMSLMIMPAVQFGFMTLEKKLKTAVWLKAGSVVLLFAVVAFSIFSFGKPGRDRELIQEVMKTGAIIPEGSMVLTEDALMAHYSLRLYLERHFNISLNNHALTRSEFIFLKQSTSFNGFKDYVEVDAGLKDFRLFRVKRIP